MGTKPEEISPALGVRAVVYPHPWSEVPMPTASWLEKAWGRSIEAGTQPLTSSNDHHGLLMDKFTLKFT